VIIVYVQAGTRVEREVGLALFGHASLALAGMKPAVFLSYVALGKRQYEHNRFLKGIWSDPLYRIQIPTAEDGCGSRVSETAVYNWYRGNRQNDGEWGAECSGFVHKALKAGGVQYYYDAAWTPKTPAFLSLWAANIQEQMGKSRDLQYWPHEPDPGGGQFFREDIYKGRNIIPWSVFSTRRANSEIRTVQFVEEFCLLLRHS
jgi:hypothetical protein